MSFDRSSKDRNESITDYLAVVYLSLEAAQGCTSGHQEFAEILGTFITKLKKSFSCVAVTSKIVHIEAPNIPVPLFFRRCGLVALSTDRLEVVY